MGGSNHVDYSLYLVTDSTSRILGGSDLVEVVEEALKGGVTVVQYRDKVSDTGPFIQLHALSYSTVGSLIPCALYRCLYLLELC
jgi:thiamine monophosphate synthase